MAALGMKDMRPLEDKKTGNNVLNLLSRTLEWEQTTMKCCLQDLWSCPTLTSREPTCSRRAGATICNIRNGRLDNKRQITSNWDPLGWLFDPLAHPWVLRPCLTQYFRFLVIHLAGDHCHLDVISTTLLLNTLAFFTTLVLLTTLALSATFWPCPPPWSHPLP